MGEHIDEVTGNRYWWPDEAADASEATPLGPEWQNLGFTSDATIFGTPSEDPGTHWFQRVDDDELLFPQGLPGRIEFELTADIDPQLAATLFGGQVPTYSGPEHSVLIEYIDTVSGAPQRPGLPRARWWQRSRKRANIEAFQAYVDQMAAWHQAGCPDIEVMRRMYVPRARINEVTRG